GVRPIQPRDPKVLDSQPNSLADRECTLERSARQDDGQFVTAVPDGGIGVAAAFAQHASDALEDRVALLMAEGVVDGFEVVEIEHQQPDWVAVTLDLFGLDPKQILEVGIVAKT